MNTDKPFRNVVASGYGRPNLKHSELTEKIIGIFYDVYNELGYGFMESVYKEAMRLSLDEAGLKVGVEAAVPVWFKGKKIGDFRADILVENLVLLELKAVRVLERAHEAQLLHYLRATEMKWDYFSISASDRNFEDSSSTMKEKRSAKIRVNPWPRF